MECGGFSAVNPLIKLTIEGSKINEDLQILCTHPVRQLIFVHNKPSPENR